MKSSYLAATWLALMAAEWTSLNPYVDEFIEFAKAHPEYKFLVTKVGCGIAGFVTKEIAPLFQKAIDVENIILPKEFVLS